MNTHQSSTSGQFFSRIAWVVIVTLALVAPMVMAQTNTFPSSGNVGIGTTGPAVKLEVQSTDEEVIRVLGSHAGGGYLRFLGSGSVTRGFVGFGPTLFAGTTISDMGFRSQGGVAFATNGGFLRMYLDTAGKVGIGTNSPAGVLDLAADTTGVFGESARFRSNYSAGGFLRFYDSLNAATRGFIGYGPTLFSGLAMTDMGFRSEGGVAFATGGGATRIYITPAGNVGIGTVTPTAALDVFGSINASGNIAAKYQDFAEWVPATEEMEPGTVVVLNTEKTNEVMPAHTPYDTSVAGVVSAQPGVILGEAGPSKAQIATVGRVRVRATAAERPIRVGDLLVTSGKSGLAMRSEPMEISGRTFHQPGTIIGKALEPLPNGEGMILVLLSLQ